MPVTSSRLPGFFKKSVEERRTTVCDLAGLNDDERGAVAAAGELSDEPWYEHDGEVSVSRVKGIGQRVHMGYVLNDDELKVLRRRVAATKQVFSPKFSPRSLFDF